MADPDEDHLFASLARDKLMRLLPWGEDERREVLDEKSHHPDAYMRAAVAAHRDTPVDALQRLMFDPEPMVVNALSSNSKLPLELARTLAEHGSDEAAAKLAFWLELDDSVFEILSTRSETVRMGVARGRFCPEHVLRRLALDESFGVRLRVATRQDCPEPVKRLLEQDPDVRDVLEHLKSIRDTKGSTENEGTE